jgi:alanine-glyoxylate transaminase/serine-glyoxylate transaminase/serine-pyruvate transaminase
MAHPLVGHLDPEFIALMNEVQDMLRAVYQTENQLTVPVSGTGSAAMEASLCNFIEAGDSVLIGVCGYFGERLCEMATRYGAKVRRIDREPGEVFTVEAFEAELHKEPAKLVALVHAETSTGALQPMDGLGELVHHYGGLLVMDCVTSLGGIPVTVDDWEVDIAYSCSQKCLGAPSGLGPITVSPRAIDVLNARQTPVANWYLDLSLLARYWGSERTYHHTAPISMNYALREALRMVFEEGLEARFARHRANAELLWEGLEELGLELFVPEERRLVQLTTVKVPEGVNEAAVRRELLETYDIEIAGGLGATKGKVWRIGLMGYSSQPQNVLALLAAMERLLS